MMKKLNLIFVLTIVLILMNNFTNACTNFLITKKASTDGSTIISYAADSHLLYGELYFTPAADWAPGTMVDIYEWDTGKFLGKIPQVAHTYSVIGNMNEHQLAIAETTFGGRKELGNQENALIDYGSLIYLTLQRAKTAREAIKVMTDLVEEYGYYSSGESFSIADGKEVWIMEMIGKGKDEKGAVWVARMVPDGYVCAHANQARITTFPLKGAESISSKQIDKIYSPKVNTVYASDVISFAKEKGYYPVKGKNKNFSFSDSYAPLTFGAARFCEIRAWSFFKDINKDMEKYFDYAKGNVKLDKKGYATNRMPLFVKPDNKISVADVQKYMRDHLEGTELDMTKDLGAGPFGNPYRWRPLTWKVNGQTYCNERATATQQTAFVFVAQSRDWLPNEIGGINWFGVDDAASTVFFPMYCGSTRIPESYAVGNGALMKYSDTSAFWIFSQVSNWAYTRYNLIHPEVNKKQLELENKFRMLTKGIDIAAKELYKEDKKAAIEFITDFSVNQGNNTVKEWKKFYQYLFMKYMDGNVKTVVKGKISPKLTQPGYSEDWKETVVKQTGNKLKVIGKDH